MDSIFPERLIDDGSLFWYILYHRIKLINGHTSVLRKTLIFLNMGLVENTKVESILGTADQIFIGIDKLTDIGSLIDE